VVAVRYDDQPGAGYARCQFVRVSGQNVVAPVNDEDGDVHVGQVSALDRLAQTQGAGSAIQRQSRRLAQRPSSSPEGCLLNGAVDHY